MKIRIRPLLIALAIPLAVGVLAALLSRGNMDLFDTVRKPPLSPPAWLFPVAWTVLYLLMGLASYRAYTARAATAQKNRALLFYAAQLAFNFFWPLLFFNLGAFTFAFFWLAALLALILVTAVKFYTLDRPAGYLLIPYVLWVLFAGYLNLGIALLN